MGASRPTGDKRRRTGKAVLKGILARLEARFGLEADWGTFRARLEAHFAALYQPLLHLYGHRPDFADHLERLLATTAQMALERPADLKALDAEREAHPHWFQSHQMVGAMCYVDLFAGNLAGLRDKLPYLKELGITYLHLLPLFASSEGNNDGGYAVSDYRQVHPALGTMDELRELARELRQNGISLVLDFVLNHTSDEHDWARRALAGDPEYQAYYHMFPDRTLPDAYEAHLSDVFPDQAPGNFTYRPEIARWVWTTFYPFQWDLNYANPTVFCRMAEEMLFLANMGVEVLRLDAVPVIWKRLGTNCRNLPETHLLIRAFNALARIVAPALIFKSEAIEYPKKLVKYLDPRGSRLAYNAPLMSLLWEALASGSARLLALSLRRHFRIHPECAWVNFVRVHDDINWVFGDEEARAVGLNGPAQRRFLNAFYSGQIAGSFARGMRFRQESEKEGTHISGTTASLAGLEKALAEGDETEIELAIRRILLLYSVILSIGGIPLLYLGDEIGTLNDYTYLNDPHKAMDSRWLHRVRTDWEKVARRTQPGTIEGRIYIPLKHLIDLRKRLPAFAGQDVAIIETANPHVLGYIRHHDGQRVIVLANFSAQEQRVSAAQVQRDNLGATWTDLVTGEAVRLDRDVVLGPYRFVWLAPAPAV